MKHGLDRVNGSAQKCSQVWERKIPKREDTTAQEKHKALSTITTRCYKPVENSYAIMSYSALNTHRMGSDAST